MTIRIEKVTYPHYNKLPKPLREALNLLRTNTQTYVVGCCDDTYVIDENDLEFLNLDYLVVWIKENLPEFDTDFFEAAARIHVEFYEDEIFNSFAVEEDHLFEELLLVKDEYELMLSKEEL